MDLENLVKRQRRYTPRPTLLELGDRIELPSDPMERERVIQEVMKKFEEKYQLKSNQSR